MRERVRDKEREMEMDNTSTYSLYSSPQVELTVDLEVFVLPVLYGNHVEGCPVWEHHPSWFLGSRRSTRSSGEYTACGKCKDTDVLISVIGSQMGPELLKVRSRHLFKWRL